MGLFGGNKDKSYDTSKLEAEIKPFLMVGEEIEKIYPLIISYFCITNKRFIFTVKYIGKDEDESFYTIPHKNVVSVGYIKNHTKFINTSDISIDTAAGKYLVQFAKGITDAQEVYNEIMKKII